MVRTIAERIGYDSNESAAVVAERIHFTVFTPTALKVVYWQGIKMPDESSGSIFVGE